MYMKQVQFSDLFMTMNTDNKIKVLSHIPFAVDKKIYINAAANC